MLIFDIFDNTVEVRAAIDTIGMISAVELTAEIERVGGEKMTVHLYFSTAMAKKIAAAIDSKIAQVERGEFDPR